MSEEDSLDLTPLGALSVCVVQEEEHLLWFNRQYSSAYLYPSP